MSARPKVPQINAVCAGITTDRGFAQGQAMAGNIRE